MALDDRCPIRSEARLFELIEERMLPGADVRKVDRRIWNTFGEEWAVLVTDLANFARQAAAFGIVHFLQLIHEKRAHFFPIARQHDGVLVGREAASFRYLFRRPEDAVRCALDMQRACRKLNDRRMADDQVLLTCGVGRGRLLHVEPGLIYGDELNAAVRLAAEVAKAQEILVTEEAVSRVDDEALPEVQFLDLGLAVPGSEQNFRVKTSR